MFEEAATVIVTNDRSFINFNLKVIYGPDLDGILVYTTLFTTFWGDFLGFFFLSFPTLLLSNRFVLDEANVTETASLASPEIM